MNEEDIAVETLEKIKKILDKHEVEYWLDEGTLLGAVREKKFIAWDHDIDLSIWYKDIEKIIPLFPKIRDIGAEVCFFKWKKHIKLVGKGYTIDINLYHLKDKKATRTWYAQNKFGQILDYLIWTLHLNNAESRESKAPLSITKALVGFSNMIPIWMIKNILKILLKLYETGGCTPLQMAVPSDFFKDFTTLEFYGMTFKVPKKTEEYLQYRYGKDWRIPRRDYIYTKDDHSIVKK